MNTERIQMNAARWVIMSLSMCFVFSELPVAAWAADEQVMLVSVTNPAPDKLPTLGVFQSEKELRVAASFPNVPGFTCDSWCYESAMDCVGIAALDGGRLELRHRDHNNPDVIYVTMITPRPGSVEFLARPELASGAKGPLPDSLQAPNLCWQLKRAANFASAPEPYPDFVKRCFIFTEKGRTYLGDTDRKLIPCRPATDKENNPPWVQMYVGTWQQAPKTTATSWADYSADKYVSTIIGAVSRDDKYLAAIVSDTSQAMCQAWHDCMHNNASWAPASAEPQERVWRVVIYAMENDPAALVQRALSDFPSLKPVPITADAPKH